MEDNSECDQGLVDFEMYKRTYEAHLEAKSLCNSLKNPNGGIYFATEMASKILMLDPYYWIWFWSIAERHGFTQVQAYVHITLVAERIFEGESKKSSNGERIIESLLSGEGIEFQREKTFPGLEHKGKLRFDFFLPNYGAVIEFNGRQHYEPIAWFGGENAFNSLVIRDEVKRQWCKQNKFHIFEIRYDEDVFDSMCKILKTLIGGYLGSKAD